MISGGCTAANTRKGGFKESEYRKILKMQKGEVPAEDGIEKKLPEMTVEEYERLGDDYLRQGNINSAFIQYDKALRMDANQVHIRYKIGMLYLKKGLVEEAVSEFQEILKKDANYDLAHEAMGNCLLRKGKFDEAEIKFSQAIKLNPKLWQSHNFLGIIYDRQKRFEAAIAEYQAAITIKPDEGLLFNNLGLSYYLNGEYEKSVDAFIKALNAGFSNNKTYNNLGLVLGKLGRYQDAMDAFRKGGDEAKAYNNIGCIYLAQGKYKEAKNSFENAIKLRPSYYPKAAENLKKAGLYASYDSTKGNTGSGIDKDKDIKDASPRLGTEEKIETSTSQTKSPENDIPGIDKYYAVQVYSSQDESYARQEAEKLKNLGHEVYVNRADIPEKGAWYRVLVGKLQTWHEAQALAKRLKDEKGINNGWIRVVK